MCQDSSTNLSERGTILGRHDGLADLQGTRKANQPANKVRTRGLEVQAKADIDTRGKAPA